MSQENVEIVCLAYEEGLARRSVDSPALKERASPDYRFHARPGWPGQSVYRLDEMPALWADLDTTFTDHRMVPTAYEDLEPYVLVTVHQTARLRGSETEINQAIYHLWLVVEEKIRETWTFAAKAEALVAAGLTE